jgi:hypothetical protein
MLTTALSQSSFDNLRYFYLAACQQREITLRVEETADAHFSQLSSMRNVPLSLSNYAAYVREGRMLAAYA